VSGRLPLVLGSAAVLAAVLIGISLLGRGGGSAPAAAAPAATQPAAVATSSLAALAGIPQHGLVLGRPDAKATLVEYGDLQCPACASFAHTSFATLVRTWVRAGKVKLEFRGLAFLGPDSAKALRFVHAAAERGRGWSAVELLYENQGAEGSGWVTDRLLRAICRALGLDGTTLLAAAGSTRYDAAIARSTRQATADGVSATPSFVVGSGSRRALLEGALPPQAFTAALEAATT
jgi:protein-disulfide isomerase